MSTTQSPQASDSKEEVEEQEAAESVEIDGSGENGGVQSLLEARNNLVATAEKIEGRAGTLGESSERKPGDVSAATIARMMGLVTSAEFSLMEGKLDLVSTKMTTLTKKLDRLLASIGDSATGSDLERIDVQIASLRALVKETLTNHLGGGGGQQEDSVEAVDAQKTPRNLVSNTDEEPAQEPEAS